MIHKPTVISAMLGIIKESQVMSPEDVAWCDSILNRDDQQSGIEQLIPLVAACDEYLKARGKMNVWESYIAEKNIAQKLYTVKALFYKQKRVMVAVPQRRKHPKCEIPNLGGFLVPQNFRADVIPVYGLGYAESRQYFVDRALAENVYSHILFVDDDILLPIDAIGRLVNAHEDIIGCNYVKRNALLESVATTIQPDPKTIFNNYMVEPKQNDYAIKNVNCLGMGGTLISMDVFKSMPKPHFEFRWEFHADGSRKRLLVGEDSLMCQKAMMAGFIPKIIPGLVPLHIDFKTGNHYGPAWLVDPVTRRCRKEFEPYYCNFLVDSKELAAPDNDDVFSVKR